MRMSSRVDDGRFFEPILLYRSNEGGYAVVGLAVLVPTNGTLSTVDPGVVSAISDALLNAGEVTPAYTRV